VWMNIEEIAQYAGISLPVVRAAIESRDLNGVTTLPQNPGQWMVRRDEVDRWVDAAAARALRTASRAREFD
jgi:excisionase family DNA binding protein